MDLIDRQAALDCFHDWIDKRGDVHTADEMVEYERIEALPAIEPQWTPCSERLPNEGITVLVTHKGGVSTAWHNGRYWERGASTNHRKLQTVVAWMPLPEPYKEK